MQAQLGIPGFELAEKFLVPFNAEARVVAALQQKLIAAEVEHLFYFAFVGLIICYVGIGMARHTKKVAKLTVGDTNVGCIYVAVDLPGNDIVAAGLFDSANLIGYPSQLGKGRVIVEIHAFLQTEGLQVQRAIQKFFSYHDRS